MRSHYLQAMGITEWRLRSSPQLSFFVYCQPLNSRAVLIAESDTQPETIAKEQILLKNICYALNADLQMKRSEWKDEYLNEFKKYPVIILMGEKLHQLGIHHLPNQQVSLTHSLKQLLASSDLKKELWKKLQQL